MRWAATGRAPAVVISGCCRGRCYRAGLARVNGRERRPGIFYFHPWEIDPDQPRIAGVGWKSRLRHYTNLSPHGGRLDQVLAEFAWDRMDRVFADLLPATQPELTTGHDASPVAA